MNSDGSTTSDITLQHVSAQPTLVVRFNFGGRDVGELMGHALDAVQEYLTRAQMSPVGPPFTRYLAMTDEVKRAETGFPWSGRSKAATWLWPASFPPVGWPAWSTRGRTRI